MLFRNLRLKAGTAIAVLLAFAWTACGGNAWAEARAAERDPAAVLARLADDPRLALSPAEKDYLRRAASRLAERRRQQPATAARIAPAASAVGAEPSAAAELRAIAAEIDALLAPAGGQAAATAAATTKAAGQAAAEHPAAQAAAAGHPAAQAAAFDHGAAVANLERRLRAADRQVMAELGVGVSRLQAAGIPTLMQERQRAAVAAYRENVDAVLGDLDAAARSASLAAARAPLAAAAARLRRSTDERPQPPLDPSRLPFRRARPVPRLPGQPPGGTPLAAAPPPTQARPAPRAAAPPPGPADLAANEDVQITPEIQAQAAALGNQPIQIYNWVRNNIEFVPTYGSVQGSLMTLVARRGNAFDTASLLIALLRAAGVPARYVTGTVEVPAAAAMSWVGGAASPDVAQQVLGQGGIPATGIANGGTVTAIRIDHVWVEAFLDYVPGRGAVPGAANAWVPMDASFKLHAQAPRSALFTANPIGTVVQPGDHFFDVDESLGKITNVDSTVYGDRLAAWASQSDSYIQANGVQPTLTGILGGPGIQPQTVSILPASLPYQVFARGAAVALLPASLRQSVSLTGYASDFDRAAGNPAFTFQVSLPALNSRRLGIEFDPATQADADVLATARSGGASSLPVYLVHMVPVVKLDGVAQATGGSVQMGSFYDVDVAFLGPEDATTISYQVVAGDEIVAGVTGNGITREIIEKRFAENPVNNAAEYFHQVQLHYWMESDYLGGMAAQSLGVHMLRLPSVGFFSSPLTVSYLFGAPTFGFYEGRQMDVKQSLLGAAGADPAKVIAFLKQAGSEGSFLEGSVFDQLEDRQTPAIKGISAMHLISDAANQGIPIYRITPATAAAAVPALQLSAAVMSDINTAVAQGKTVLVPQTNVNIGPWSGVGYIIQDETTGAGAYLISGGASGGGLLDCIKELAPKFIEVLLLVLLILLLIILIILLLGGLAEVLAALAAAGAAAAEAFAGFELLLQALGGLSLAF